MKRFVKIHFFENLRVALSTGCATSRRLGNTYKDMIMNKNMYVYFSTAMVSTQFEIIQRDNSVLMR